LALANEVIEKTKNAKKQWEKIIEMYKNSKNKNKFYLLAQKKLKEEQFQQ
jgi:hypothetical protein